MLQRRGEAIMMNYFKMTFKEWIILEEVSEKLHAVIPMPEEIILLNNLFKKHNKKLYAVGGAVRDFLINKLHQPQSKYSPKDVDITTDAKPDEVIAILNSPEAKANGIKSFPKGEAFGVVSAIINGQEFEIATFREDYYDPTSGDGRRPDKVEFSTPEKDAQRRDLTMNALFYDIDKNEILDFNTKNGVGQGIEDIKNLIARPVGDPEKRFAEDKLRILRLIRFFSRFNPGLMVQHIDNDTKNAIEKYKKLEGVSPERIVAEFTNGFKSAANKKTYLQNYEDFDLFATILPNLIVNLQNYLPVKSFPATLAFILRDNTDPQKVRSSLNALKYSNEVTDKIELLLMLNDFDKYQILTLLKKKNAISQNIESDIEDFGKLTTNKQIQNFVNYKQQTKSQDFMHLKGPQIAQAMNQTEKEMFTKLI